MGARVLCALWLLWLGLLPALALPLDSLSVQVSGAGRRQARLLETAHALLPFRPGRELSATDLERARRLLEDSRFFERVTLHADSSRGRLVLGVDLRAALVVEELTVRGQRPFFEYEILDLLAVRPGSVYDSTRVAAQDGAIREFYRRNGRRLDSLVIRTDRDSLAGTVRIRLELESDRFVRLGELRISGNRAVDTGRIRRKLSVWRNRFWPGEGGRFQESRLADDLDELRRWYRARGHAEITVSARQTPREGPDPRIDLEIVIQEGPRYKVHLQGNRRLGDARLRRALSLKSRGNRADATLRRDREALEELYHRRGCMFARVELDAPRVEPDARLRPVVYRITEGPRVRIRSLRILGAEPELRARLERNVLSRRGRALDGGLALDDRAALEQLLKDQGYRQARVELQQRFSQDSSRVELDFRVEPGPATTLETRLEAVTRAGWPADSLDRVLAPGQPWSVARADQVREQVREELARSGFALPRITETRAWLPDSSRVIQSLQVDPGPRQITGQTFFRGNSRTSARYLGRELGLAPGSAFSRQALLKGQQRLQDLPVLAGARLRTLGADQDTVHLVAELEERAPWYLEGAGGYHSSDGAYLRARGGQRNLFGRARHLWLGGRLAQTARRVEGGLIDPRFLGRRLAASLTVYGERLELLNQTFGSDSRGLELAIDRDLGRHGHGRLSLVREQRTLFGSLGSTWDSLAALDAFEPRNRVALAPAFDLDTRDGFLRPQHGLLGRLELELSHGLDSRLEDYLRSELDLRGYHALRPGLVLAAVIRASRVGDLGTGESPPADRLFFLGGSRTVRGFAENLLVTAPDGTAVGGALAFSSSLEIRRELGHRWELALFTDQGLLAREPDGTDRQPLRGSAGAGLRLQTAIGPLGVVYGWKLDPRPGEDPGRFHFSLGYPF